MKQMKNRGIESNHSAFCKCLNFNFSCIISQVIDWETRPPRSATALSSIKSARLKTLLGSTHVDPPVKLQYLRTTKLLIDVKFRGLGRLVA